MCRAVADHAHRRTVLEARSDDYRLVTGADAVLVGQRGRHDELGRVIGE